MNRLITSLALVICSTSLMADDLKDRADASRATVKEFAKTLQGKMQMAMKEGGPLNAIKVCNADAPGIATDMSNKKGWDVGRTSLKIRSAANAPDAWETKVLNDFEKQKAEGADPKKLEHYEVVTENGKKVFRYMKAIPTGKVCTNCHGDNIDPAVNAKLKELYPNDKATGFKVGDIRGAFTITQPM
jgi:hypothetical protein